MPEELPILLIPDSIISKNHSQNIPYYFQRCFFFLSMNTYNKVSNIDCTAMPPHTLAMMKTAAQCAVQKSNMCFGSEDGGYLLLHS